MMLRHVRLYREDLLPGWVYPCSLEEIACVLEQLPQEDLEGLRAVGLRRSTNKRWDRNGVYWFSDRKIALFSMREGLTYKLGHSYKGSDMRSLYVVERRFGMTYSSGIGGMFVHWEFADWRRFILCHVLLHEVGHHVRHHRIGRTDVGYESEQFAEGYAQRLGPTICIPELP